MNHEIKKAFTLIELLVVIAIIALLVSILLPSLNAAKDLARGVVCLSNMKGLLLQNQFYIDDYKGDFFTRTDPTIFWFDQFREYGENVDLVNCPSSSHLTPYDSCNLYLSSGAPYYNVNVGYNGWIATNSYSPAMNVTELSSADKTVMFSDAYDRSGTSLTGTAYIQFIDWNVWSLVEKRHNKMTKANAGYADGHADHVGDDIMEFTDDNESRLFWLGK